MHDFTTYDLQFIDYGLGHSLAIRAFKFIYQPIEYVINYSTNIHNLQDADPTIPDQSVRTTHYK